MAVIEFGIIGAGWRTEFFSRIVKALPERFHISGIMVRDENKGKAFEDKWRIRTCTSMDKLLAIGNPSFIIVSVPWATAPVMTRELVKRGMPVLSETPPAPDLEGLKELYGLVEKGARIQVAEQYHLQPLHAARIAVAASGKLGEISQVQTSVCHGYHAVSLIRKFLGVKFEKATISARVFDSPLISGPDRNGVISEEVTVSSKQVIAFVDFDGKMGMYDFTYDQYFSWVRSLRLLVRGNRGEIVDNKIKYLKDYKTPVEIDLLRQSSGENGNLEGYYLKGILAGDEWVYKNPMIPGRITDDEIAIATCLEKMYLYAKGGQDFYSLAEAAQDHYLSLMINKAAESGEKVKTELQPWALG